MYRPMKEKESGGFTATLQKLYIPILTISTFQALLLVGFYAWLFRPPTASVVIHSGGASSNSPHQVSIGSEYSYSQASAVCAALDQRLCSLDELCPGASGKAGGFHPADHVGGDASDQWSPVNNVHNAWVQLGAADWRVCGVFHDSSVHGTFPKHGGSGSPYLSSGSDVKSNVYCCPSASSAHQLQQLFQAPETWELSVPRTQLSPSRCSDCGHGSWCPALNTADGREFLCLSDAIGSQRLAYASKQQCQQALGVQPCYGPQRAFQSVAPPVREEKPASPVAVVVDKKPPPPPPLVDNSLVKFQPGDTTAVTNLERTCGNWQADYIALHKRILSLPDGHPEKRFLVFRCNDNDKCGGLGDRFVGLISSLMIAVLTNRAFLIWWDQLPKGLSSPHINVNFYDVFPDADIGLPAEDVNANNNWQKCSNWACIKSNDQTFFWNWHNYYINRETKKPWITTADLDQMFQQPVVMFRTNRGMTTAAFQSPLYGPVLSGMGLEKETAFGCFFEFLLEPSLETANRFLPAVQSLRDPETMVIGIHVRTGDNHMESEKDMAVTVEQFPKYFKCAEQIMEEWQATPSLSGAKPKIKWLLLSDSVQLREDAEKKYGDLLLPRGGAIGHTDPRFIAREQKHKAVDVDETFQVALGENYYLGGCDYFIVGVSGFSMTAVMRSRKEGLYRVGGRYKTRFHDNIGQDWDVDGEGEEDDEVVCSATSGFLELRKLYDGNAHL